MSDDACRLDPEQRAAVHEQVAETCRYRKWTLHAINCRSNHLHIVVTANLPPQNVRSQLKAWCTRKLKHLAQLRELQSGIRDKWWAERGSHRYVNDEPSLEQAIIYVRDLQDGRPPHPSHQPEA
jgi:REP element-mobilizing transposase RayT